MPTKTAIDMIPAGTKYYRSRADYPGQAPPWRAGLPIKRFTGVTGPYKYLGKDASGLPTLLNHDAPSDDSVNLPGLYHYPSYSEWWAQRKTSQVTVSSPAFSGLVEKGWLFTPVEAQAFAAEIRGGSFPVEATDYMGVTATYNYPPDEDRRVWRINVGLAVVRMEDSWLAKSASGVGWPGVWTIGDSGLRFTTMNQNDGSLETREVPPPCRDLAANEYVALGTELLNIGQVVVKSRGEEAQQASGGGGFSAADRQMLMELHAKFF